MKCNELMVGDWVADDRGFPVQVVSVGNDYLYAKYESSEYAIVEFNDMDNKLYPILLTDEFFKKNDFDKKILHWSEGGIIYEKDGSNGYNIAIRRFDAPFGPSANVHYVHELQQLLRLGGYTELANNVKL
uniref:hypothetical protein n=1 Tax=Candidatus Cryptobacteroides bacterium TaxID=3085639 RepID=UPI004027A8CA